MHAMVEGLLQSGLLSVHELGAKMAELEARGDVA
jgi:hypothetical protein